MYKNNHSLTDINQFDILVLDKLERNGDIFQLLWLEVRFLVVFPDSFVSQYLEEDDKFDAIAKIGFKIVYDNICNF